MSVPTVLIMAAGRGTRMHSQLPKVLHEVCGRPLLLWPVEAAREAGAEKIVVVLGPDADRIKPILPDNVEVAIQDPPAGTGDAVLAARDAIASSNNVIVLSGDTPLLGAHFLESLAASHASVGAAATITTQVLDDPGSFGRIVRDANGDVDRIVETKAPGDATVEELAINEVNAGTYAFATTALLKALAQVAPDNAQGEIYLGDALPFMREDGGRIVAHRTDDGGASMGINNRVDLARVQQIAQQRELERHMLAGVTIVDPAATVIDVGARIGADTTIEPFCSLRGEIAIASGATIGPLTMMTNCSVGEGSSVVQSHLSECDVLAGCKVGPFAHIRPKTRLGDGAKVGAFAEVKNAEVGEGAKIPHLSYVGDADMGARSNLGAGTITANYDGKNKHRTVIGADVRTGINTSLVAPVHVGDGAYTGAGSVITQDVPPGALGITRPPQANVEGYAERKEEQSKENSKP